MVKFRFHVSNNGFLGNMKSVAKGDTFFALISESRRSEPPKGIIIDRTAVGFVQADMGSENGVFRSD